MSTTSDPSLSPVTPEEQDVEPLEPTTTEDWDESKLVLPIVSITFRFKMWNVKKEKFWIFILVLLVCALCHVQFHLMHVTMLTGSMIPTDSVDHLPMTNPWSGRSMLEETPDSNIIVSEPTNDDDGDDKEEAKEDEVQQQPMNVLIIYPDDWRHDSLEDAQPSLIHTPFLSQLAREGIRFTRNAVTSSICWISRATLFSGRYASQHRSIRPLCPLFTDFENWKQSWPYMLMEKRGYFVGHIGKWQFTNNNQFFAGTNGFNWTRIHENHHWYTLKNKTEYHAADRAKDDAIAFLRERPTDRPFALTVAFYPPKAVGTKSEPGAQWSPKDNFYELYKDHQFVEPYNFSEAYEALPSFLKGGEGKRRFDQRWSTHDHYVEGMKRYHALVSQVDRATEHIIEELKRQNLYNNTMIIITADNGLMLGAHGLAGKWQPYEESIRVPLLIRDPRMPLSKQGNTDDSFTLNIDLAPTILGAAGIKPSPFMQGHDISDLYLTRKKKTAPWREDFFYEMPLNEFPASSALITRKWKYATWPSQDNYEQMFDLENDPYELHDVLTEKGTNDTTTRRILEKLRLRYQVVRDLAISIDNTSVFLPPCTQRQYGGDFEAIEVF